MHFLMKMATLRKQGKRQRAKQQSQPKRVAPTGIRKRTVCNVPQPIVARMLWTWD